MILKGSQRGGGGQLAFHLLRQDDNDHVTVHDIRGFVAEDRTGALNEAYAISRGTKCRQYLFSLSLSPPETERVPVSAFENAVAEIEDRLGLAGQPRAIVFHEKLGRRHAHCVWSRIKADEMKAINISHYKLKLREHSRQLYVKHGWQMPRGLMNSEERNPLNFSREEWQQALRTKRDPRNIKQIFQDCWAISDGLAAFKNALEARGFHLALGDRRGFVAIDWQNEIYSVSRWVGVRAKDLRAKLGEPDQLPTVKEVCATLARKVDNKHRSFANEIRAEFETARIGLLEERKLLVEQQRQERKLLRVT